MASKPRKSHHTRPDAHNNKTVGQTSVTPLVNPFAVVCVLSLVFAAFGLLLGYAGSDANRYLPFDHGAEIIPASQTLKENGLPFQRTAVNYTQLFPDIALPMALALLSTYPPLGIYLYSLFIWMAIAAGAFFLARRLSGLDTAAWLSLPIIALMPLLITLNHTEELFVTAIVYGFRGGLFALLLPVLGLSLSTLFAHSLHIATRYAAALVAVLFLLITSYVITPVWLTLPLLAALLFLFISGNMHWKENNWKILLAAIVAAHLAAAIFGKSFTLLFLSDIYQHTATQATFSLALFMRAWHFFSIWLKYIATEHPVLLIIWLMFIALCASPLIKALWVGFNTTKTAKKKKKIKPSPAAPALYALAFLLAATLLPLAAALLTGKLSLWGRVEHFANHRYFLPTVYIPLFAGWPLLLIYYLPFLRRHFAERVLAATAWSFTIIVLFCSLPLFRHIAKIGALTEYSSPFLTCTQDVINRHQLTSGLVPTDFYGDMNALLHAADGEAPLELTPVSNHRALMHALRQPFDIRKQHPFMPEGLQGLALGSGAKKAPDTFDFIIINSTDERKSMPLPEKARCPQRLHKPEECYDYYFADLARHFINEQEVREYYGNPVNRFRCEGIDFLIYDDMPYAPTQ